MRYAATAGRWSFDTARRGVARGLSAAAALPRAAMDLVFPATCASCQIELDPDNSTSVRLAFCAECYDSLDLLQEPMCRRCGGPLPLLTKTAIGGAADSAAAVGCYRCGGRKMWFDETIAAGLYEGRLRQLMLAMKSEKGDPLSLAMGRLLWQLRCERLDALGVDVVAPIPLHWRRRLVHRTNSAAIVAEVLADKLRVPLAGGLLRRRRHTRPQSELTPAKRWTNVRQAFALRAGYHLKQAHVLLVDDILTTGATCSDAARALRKAGAERVTVAVIARAIG